MDDASDFLGEALRGSTTVVGRLESLSQDGAALVSTDPGGPLQSARSIVELGAGDVGRDAVILCDPREPDSPVILGMIRANPLASQPSPVQVDADGQSVTVQAEREIRLECGDASITLTSAGRIELRGTDILSRARSWNKIKGGAIQLN